MKIQMCHWNLKIKSCLKDDKWMMWIPEEFLSCRKSMQGIFTIAGLSYLFFKRCVCLFVLLLGKEQSIDGAVEEEGSSGSAICWSLPEER